MHQALLLDPGEIERLVARRRATGADRGDEVAPEGASVLAGANVSDRGLDWEHDYRCPDVVVVLPGGRARDLGSHWQGGPDLLVEVVSPHDRSRDKLEFYARLGVREVLLIEPGDLAVELVRLAGGSFTGVGRLAGREAGRLELETLPVTVTREVDPPVLRVSVRPHGKSYRI